jgi:uncharacterized protein YeaO (DUF488 family)
MVSILATALASIPHHRAHPPDVVWVPFVFGGNLSRLGAAIDFWFNGGRMTIRVKRVYEEPDESDGRRILVDRLWPRGLSKEAARVDLWMKEISPSTELRRWYGHDPDKWLEFKARYAEELAAHQGEVEELSAAVRAGTVTLLYSSKERKLNNAVALKEYLESRQPAHAALAG